MPINSGAGGGFLVDLAGFRGHRWDMSGRREKFRVHEAVTEEGKPRRVVGCFLCGSIPARKRTPYNKPDGTKGLLPTCGECHIGLPVEQDPETGEWVMTFDLE